MPPQFFTVAEVAAQLRVSEDTVRRLVSKRLLRSVRVGSCVRISAAHLDSYLAPRETDVQTAARTPRVRGTLSAGSFFSEPRRG